MKAEQKIYMDLVRLIKKGDYNSSSTLRLVNNKFRTSRIIDLIFSNPNIFNLADEIKYVPEELLTTQILIKFILANPRNIFELNEKQLTIPVLMAFEFSKRWANQWISYYTLGHQLTKKKTAAHKRLLAEYKTLAPFINDLLDYENLDFMTIVSRELNRYYGLNGFSIYRGHTFVGIEADKMIVILIDGAPRSGKSYLGNILTNMLIDSYSFDSDDLLEKDLLDMSFDEVIEPDAKVIIFSDIDAANFFSSNDLDDKIVINITVHTSDEEIPTISVPGAICVQNDFTDNIYSVASQTLESIINKVEAFYLGQGSQGKFGIAPLARTRSKSNK